MMPVRWLHLPALTSACLLAVVACGGDNGDGSNGDDGGAVATGEPDSGASDREASATVIIEIAGETYEETGGGCTKHDGGEGLAVNVGQPRGTGLSISVGTTPGSQKADSGDDITDATVRFSTDGVVWTPTEDGGVVLRIDPGLGSGTFSGTFVALESGRTELVEGSFTC